MKTISMDTAESEVTTEDRPPPSNFERAQTFTSSFHGDRYYSEDIYKVTDHVKIGFDDIFAEPVALKTGDIGQVLSPPIRKVFSLIFIYTQAAIYYFLTLVFGMFLGFAWGACFGVVHFAIIWLAHPTLKVLFVVLRLVAMPSKALVRAFGDPLFQAMGQIFSFISAKFRLRLFGLESVAGMDGGKSAARAMLRANTFSNRNSYPSEWLGFV